MAGSIFIPLISVFDARGVNQAKGAMASLGAVAKSVKGTLATMAVSFATIGISNFVQDAVASARDLERGMVGLQGVFGDMTPGMQQFTKDASSIGMSQVEAAKASTFLGSVLKQSGFTMADTADQTKNLVGLASDLAATYTYDVSEALTGMTALFRGEYDPIEKFGVAMKQSEVNALLLQRGQNKLTGSALRHAQAIAKLDLLYSRSKDAQGAYARQSDGLYVKQKNLEAAFKNMQAAVGKSLTGPLADLLSALTPLIEQMGPVLTPIFESFAKIVKTLTPLIGPLVEIFMTLWEALTPIIDAFAQLLKPLLVPIVMLVRLLVKVLKPLIPVITLIANVISAILVPAFTVLGFAFSIAIKMIESFVDGLAHIPFIGDLFKDANKSLKDTVNGFNSLNDKLLDIQTSNDSLTKKLSKPIKSNPIDTLKASYQGAADAAKAAAEATGKLIDEAKQTQQSLIGAFDITGILKNNTQSINESVVYVNGQFKAIVTKMSGGPDGLVAAYSSSLSKLKTFYRNLQKLAKAGLDPELRSQLVSAGPEAGNATAEAIISSGKTGIKELNKTFLGIKKVSGDIGVKTATSMKAVGERMGNGLIDGLIAKRQDLIDTATSIGESMADAISEAMRLTHIGFRGLSDTTDSSGTATPQSWLVSPFKAMLPGQNSFTTKFETLMPNQLVNPFNYQDKGYFQFEGAVAKANQYHIAIQVAPGTPGREVGQALVKAITEYERTAGKGWRTN